MTVFKVEIQGVPSREHHEAINASIQKAVLSHLGGFDGDAEGPRAIALTRWLKNGLVAVNSWERIHDLTTDPSKVKSIAKHDAPLGYFEVKVDGIDLPRTQKTAIAVAIQTAVLPHLSVLDLRGDGVAAAILDPPQWMGLIARPYDVETLGLSGARRE